MRGSPSRCSGTGAPTPATTWAAWLARRTDVTAVFVSNDQMALGVLHAFHEAGRSVPGDVSVVGYDDIPEAAHLLPPLTTVRTDFAEIGTRALRLLLSRIDERTKPPGPESLVPVDLVVRASSGAAPGR